MINSNIVIICVIFLNKIINTNAYNINSLTANNKKDLVDIIKSLNYDIDEKIEYGNKVEEKDEFHELSDEAKEKKLQHILWLLKKNLNALKLHDEMIKDPVHTGSRIYFIKNPEVIEKYKDYVKKKKILLANAKTDLIKLKRRTESRAESSDESEAKDVDRTEMRDDKDTIKEKSDKSTETTQNIIDSVQENQSLNAEELTEKTDKRKLEVNKEESYTDRTKEETAEKHNKRAKEEEPTDTVKRKEIPWSDTNDKSVDKRQKNRKEIKDKYESFERKEKRYDDYRQDSFVSKPKHKINYRKPKSEIRKDYFAYGRTSIPFIAALITSQGRKYDINQEASKLYGEDLHTVLQRFRRTPEYLKILNIKLTELLNTMEVIYHDAMSHHRNRLEEKLTKMFLPNSTQLRTFDNRNFNIFLFKKRKVPKLKSKKLELINLDNYLKDRSYLTFDEKKRVHDLVYEHFGLALHDFIAGFSGEDSLPVSTKLPNGGDQPFSTTTGHDHVVTSEPTATETESPETTAAHHHSTARPESDRNFRSPINRQN